MNVEEIQAKLDALIPVMLGKGMREPKADATIKANEEPYVHLGWKSRKEGLYGGDSAYSFHNAASIEEAFRKADVWLSDRPDAETAKLNEFLAAIGSVADLGKELGIDAEFVNPLLVTMKKLSENALTFQGEA